MVAKNEKLIGTLSNLPFDIVRTAFIARCRIETRRITDYRVWMTENGFEQLESVPDNRHMTEDGREILRAHGKTWALQPEIHAQRKEEALEQQRRWDEAERKELATKSVVGTESLADIACPRCQEALEHSTVCPNCAAGKTGFKHRYTCVNCNAELVTREEL